MRPEPVEGQDDHASTSSASTPDEAASTSSAHIHEESDEKAPIKGAVPEGESEPDAETKPESLTGQAPDVGSGATEAEEDEAQLAAAEPTAGGARGPQGHVRRQGSGDTSGYGGLTRAVEFPAAASPPFGGWWDQVYERIGALVPNYSDVITKVVIHRGEITFHVAASICQSWSSICETTPTCGSSSAAACPGCTIRPTRVVSCTRSTTCSR